jgi:hypothetical protein
MRKIVSLFLLMFCTTVLAASETWKNVALVDTMCLAKVKDDPDKHTAECAIACSKGGYGIIAADGTFLKFDEAGNAKALEALKASTKKDHLRATVIGERSGETLKVSSLKLE